MRCADDVGEALNAILLHHARKIGDDNREMLPSERRIRTALRLSLPQIRSALRYDRPRRMSYRIKADLDTLYITKSEPHKRLANFVKNQHFDL